MNLNVTPMALKQLRELKRTDNKVLRIDAEMQGGCGTMIRFKLIEDDSRKSDTVITAEGLEFFVDLFTKRNLDEELKLDFDEHEGFLFESEWGPMGLECHLA